MRYTECEVCGKKDHCVFAASEERLSLNGWMCSPCYCKVYDAEEFILRNKPAPVRPQSFDNGDATRQLKMIDGMNCLPGQLDLFD